MFKKTWFLLPLIMLLGLVSCDKDPMGERNYLVEPFFVNHFHLNTQVFTLAAEEFPLTIEESQQNRHIGFIQRSDIDIEQADQMGFELRFAIDPKKYEVTFNRAEATIVTTSLQEITVPVHLELINTEEDGLHSFLTYQVETSALEQAINKEEFKHVSFILYSEYTLKKGKKTTEPRNMRFMVYVKS